MIVGAGIGSFPLAVTAKRLTLEPHDERNADGLSSVAIAHEESQP
jgi:hypothetical protein